MPAGATPPKVEASRQAALLPDGLAIRQGARRGEGRRPTPVAPPRARADHWLQRRGMDRMDRMNVQVAGQGWAAARAEGGAAALQPDRGAAAMHAAAGAAGLAARLRAPNKAGDRLRA